jgi:hypothetical protein
MFSIASPSLPQSLHLGLTPACGGLSGGVMARRSPSSQDHAADCFAGVAGSPDRSHVEALRAHFPQP